MTTTPPDASAGPGAGPHVGPHDGPRVGRDEVRDLARLRRSRTDRKIAGVAGGIARHLDIDPLLVRVALVVLVFFGGASLLLYAGAWLLVPEDGADRARINLDERSRSVALGVVGVLALLVLVGDSWGAFRFPWPLVLVGLLVLWLVTRDGSRRTPPAAAPPAGPGAPYGPNGSYGTYGGPYGAAGGPASEPGGPVPGPTASFAAHAPSTTTVPAPGEPGGTSTAAGPGGPTGPAGPASPAGPAGPPWSPPPAYVPPPPAPAPPDPRRHGPRLFGATLALIALALGVLGMVDLAGADLPTAAYPALAVTVCGAMLLLGSVWGRAGGVILIGLLSSVVLVGTAAGEHWGGRWSGDRTVVEPVSAAEVDTTYSFDPGDATLDLSGVRDVKRLDGRVVRVHGSVGQVTVLVPRGLAVVVDANIDGPGSAEAFGQDADGWGVHRVWRHGSLTEPTLRLVVDISAGHVEVDQS